MDKIKVTITHSDSGTIEKTYESQFVPRIGDKIFMRPKVVYIIIDVVWSIETNEVLITVN